MSVEATQHPSQIQRQLENDEPDAFSLNLIVSSVFGVVSRLTLGIPIIKGTIFYVFFLTLVTATVLTISKPIDKLLERTVESISQFVGTTTDSNSMKALKLCLDISAVAIYLLGLTASIVSIMNFMDYDLTLKQAFQLEIPVVLTGIYANIDTNNI